MSSPETRTVERKVRPFLTKPAIVLLGGLGLAAFDANLGLGLSVRIPFTESNCTVAGSVGHKNLSRETLPSYVSDKVAGNENFLNSSHTLTIWKAEGTSMFVCGKQTGAPWIDLHIKGRTGSVAKDEPTRE